MVFKILLKIKIKKNQLKIIINTITGDLFGKERIFFGDKNHYRLKPDPNKF